MHSVLSLVEKNDEFNLLCLLNEPGEHYRDELHSVKNNNGECALHVAIRNNNLRIIRILIEHGTEVSLTNAQGENSYQLAIKDDKVDMIELLTELRPPKKSYGLLQWAVRSNSFRSIEMLLDRKIIPVNESHLGSTALHVAAQMGNVEMARILIKYKANVNARSSATGVSPIFYTISLDHPRNEEMFALLLSEGANPNHVNDDNETLLHETVKKHKIEMAKRLLAKGAHVDIPNAQNETPLYCAIEIKSIPFVAFLLEFGANPNFSKTPALKHVLTNMPSNPDAIELTLLVLLLQYGADPNAVINRNGDTILHFAIVYNDAIRRQVTSLLLEYGGNINIKGKDWATPFWHLVTCGEIDEIEVALAYGADVHVQNHNGHTPLHRIVFQNRLIEEQDRRQKMDLLLAHGADVNVISTISNRTKVTMLQSIVMDWSSESELWLLQYLLSVGANPNIPTHDNRTLWDIIVFDLDEQKVKDKEKKKLIKALIQGGLKYNENACKRLRWYREIAAYYRIFPFLVCPKTPLALTYVIHSFLC